MRSKRTESDALGVHGVLGVTYSVSKDRRSRSLLTILLFCSLLLSGSILTLFRAFNASSTVDSECFIALSLQGLYFAFAIMMTNLRRPIYIFEPYTIVTVVYVLVYHAAAVFQLCTGDTVRYGVDARRYMLLGSFFVVLGHMAFTLGYGLKDRAFGVRSKKPFFHEPIQPNSILKLAYCMYTVSFCLFMIYQLSRGFNLYYVITGGLSSDSSLSIQDSSLSFLMYSSYSLIGSWVLVFLYGKNRLITFLLYILTLLLCFFGGSRAQLIIPLMAPIVLIYIHRKSSPSLSTIVGALGLLVILFAVIQVARVGIRTGGGFNLEGESLSSLFEPFYAEIDDFKVYYGLFGVVPEKHPFLLGKQMIIASITILIPRAIWPGKPEPQIYEIINTLYGPRAVLDGVAYPNLGEYYVEFGYLGILICMFIFGLLCRYVKGFYAFAFDCSLSQVAYSLIYPALFQLIIRGYMPQNFTMLLFLLVPVVFAGLLNNVQCMRGAAS